MKHTGHEEIEIVRGGGSLGGVTLSGRHVKQGGAMKTFRHLGAYAVVFLRGGGGWYEDERGYRALLDVGDVIVIEPEVGHRYGPEGDGEWSEFYVIFEGMVFDLWHESGFLRSGLWKNRGTGLMGWGEELEAGVRKYAGDPLVLTGFVQMMLGELMKFDVEEGAIATMDEWVVRSMKLLGRATLGPVEVAKEVGMGYEHFRKEFKKRVGQSPDQFRHRQVAMRAWHMLAGSDRPIREVAEALGFCDEYYFSRFFKKQLGMTPGEVRKARRR